MSGSDSARPPSAPRRRPTAGYGKGLIYELSVSILEARECPRLPKRRLQLFCKFNNSARLNLYPIYLEKTNPQTAVTFNWELDQKELARLKSQNAPIKVQVFLSTEDEPVDESEICCDQDALADLEDTKSRDRNTRLGYVILKLRNALTDRAPSPSSSDAGLRSTSPSSSSSHMQMMDSSSDFSPGALSDQQHGFGSWFTLLNSSHQSFFISTPPQLRIAMRLTLKDSHIPSKPMVDQPIPSIPSSPPPLPSSSSLSMSGSRGRASRASQDHSPQQEQPPVTARKKPFSPGPQAASSNHDFLNSSSASLSDSFSSSLSSSISSSSSSSPQHSFRFAIDLRAIRDISVSSPIQAAVVQFQYPVFGAHAPISTFPPISIANNNNDERLLPHGYCLFEFIASPSRVQRALNSQPLVLQLIDQSTNALIGYASINCTTVLSVPFNRINADEIGIPSTRCTFDDTLIRQRVCDEYVPVASNSRQQVASLRIVLTLEDLGPIHQQQQQQQPFSPSASSSSKAVSFSSPAAQQQQHAQQDGWNADAESAFVSSMLSKQEEEQGEPIIPPKMPVAASSSSSVPAAPQQDESAAAMERMLAEKLMRETPEYQAAFDLEVWKRTEEDRFMQQLIEREAQRTSEWEKSMREKANAQEQAMMHRQKEMDSLREKLLKSVGECEKREIKLVSAEKDMSKRKQDLEKEAERRLAEIQDTVRRAQEECVHKVAMERNKVVELEKQCKSLQQRWEQSESSSRRLMDEFQEYRLKQASTPEFELQSRIAQLQAEKLTLEKRVAHLHKRKKAYKNQWKSSAEKCTELQRQNDDLNRSKFAMEEKDLTRIRGNIFSLPSPSSFMSSAPTSILSQPLAGAAASSSVAPPQQPVSSLPVPLPQNQQQQQQPTAAMAQAADVMGMLSRLQGMLSGQVQPQPSSQPLQPIYPSSQNNGQGSDELSDLKRQLQQLIEAEQQQKPELSVEHAAAGSSSSSQAARENIPPPARAETSPTRARPNASSSSGKGKANAPQAAAAAGDNGVVMRRSQFFDSKILSSKPSDSLDDTPLMIRREIRRLLQEKEDMMKTGVYSEDDKIVAELNRQIAVLKGRLMLSPTAAPTAVFEGSSSRIK